MYALGNQGQGCCDTEWCTGSHPWGGRSRGSGKHVSPHGSPQDSGTQNLRETRDNNNNNNNKVCHFTESSDNPRKHQADYSTSDDEQFHGQNRYIQCEKLRLGNTSDLQVLRLPSRASQSGGDFSYHQDLSVGETVGSCEGLWDGHSLCTPGHPSPRWVKAGMNPRLDTDGSHTCLNFLFCKPDSFKRQSSVLCFTVCTGSWRMYRLSIE